MTILRYDSVTHRVYPTSDAVKHSRPLNGFRAWAKCMPKGRETPEILGG